MAFCDCEDGINIVRNYPSLFVKDPSYGWVLHWVEYSNDYSHVTPHNYGLSINFCPMCGKKIDNSN